MDFGGSPMLRNFCDISLFFLVFKLISKFATLPSSVSSNTQYIEEEKADTENI